MFGANRAPIGSWRFVTRDPRERPTSRFRARARYRPKFRRNTDHSPVRAGIQVAFRIPASAVSRGAFAADPDKTHWLLGAIVQNERELRRLLWRKRRSAWPFRAGARMAPLPGASSIVCLRRS